MITATRRFEWDAAHRVLRHESKCATLHGHRYVAEVTLSAPELDHVGRVLDFGAIKQLIGDWIDQHWDHTTLVTRADVALIKFCGDDHDRGKRPAYVFDGEPTAENIALQLLAVARHLLQALEVRVERVRVYETPNCWADATTSDGIWNRDGTLTA